MTTNHASYDLANLRRELRAQLPHLMRGAPRLAGSFVGRDRLAVSSRLALHLRLARLLGCPVCLAIFPRLGRACGLDQEAIDSALAGRPEHLSEQAYGAVTWVGELVTAGETPELVPAPAMALTAGQRRHLVELVRLERLVHAAGLVFLPRRLLAHALEPAAGRPALSPVRGE